MRAANTKQKKSARPISNSFPPPQSEEKWPNWERKVEKLCKRDYDSLKAGWLAHIPTIDPIGNPPQGGLGSIQTVREIFSQVKRTGDCKAALSGARPAVLHEAIYLAHKAVHVQKCCADAVHSGRHTWAIVDAYQGSLFALGSILAFLGITVVRDKNDFMLIDVWSEDVQPQKKRSSQINVPHETYQFIRFQKLDHFHKWAILKRVLRTFTAKSQLVQLLSEVLNDLDDKSFAKHRNSVHYESNCWLSNDLLVSDLHGPVKPAQSSTDLFNDIYSGNPVGTIYLMCALVEVACMFLSDLKTNSISEETRHLDSRLQSLRTLTNFDWKTLYNEAS